MYILILLGLTFFFAHSNRLYLLFRMMCESLPYNHCHSCHCHIQHCNCNFIPFSHFFLTCFPTPVSLSILIQFTSFHHHSNRPDLLFPTPPAPLPRGHCRTRQPHPRAGPARRAAPARGPARGLVGAPRWRVREFFFLLLLF
jgi:hypothetical protein